MRVSIEIDLNIQTLTTLYELISDYFQDNSIKGIKLERFEINIANN